MSHAHRASSAVHTASESIMALPTFVAFAQDFVSATRAWGMGWSLAVLLCLGGPPSAAAQSAKASESVSPQNASYTALVAHDHVPLRAAPSDSAASLASLWQGEWVEVRATRLDHVQVWSHQRERGGYVRTTQLRRIGTAPADADSLLAVLRFVKDAPASEGLTLGYGAAWLKVAPAAQVQGALGAEVLDAMATAAERLAQRAMQANASKAAQEAIAAQLDAARQYGVRFESREREGKVQLCYDGALFERILTLPAAQAEQRVRAALALTRSECEDPQLALSRPLLYRQNTEARAALLDKVRADAVTGAAGASGVTGVAAHWTNRLHLRRAMLWSMVAYDRARSAEASPLPAAQRALDELALVNKADLTDEDQATFNDAVMRVNASRWASMAPTQPTVAGLAIQVTAGDLPGQACVRLVQGAQTLHKQCTYGLVWSASFSANREGSAAALAVQTQAGWREMWIWRKDAVPKSEAGSPWRLDVLVPAALEPGLGYVELAGWAPGGRQMLVAREARGEGKYQRSYEVRELDTLQVSRQAGDPSLLGAFQRWAQPQWKQMSVSLR